MIQINPINNPKINNALSENTRSKVRFGVILGWGFRYTFKVKQKNAGEPAFLSPPHAINPKIGLTTYFQIPTRFVGFGIIPRIGWHNFMNHLLDGHFVVTISSIKQQVKFTFKIIN